MRHDSMNETPKQIYDRLRGMGLGHSYAHQLANKKRTPSLQLAFQIADAAKIPLEHWRPSGH